MSESEAKVPWKIDKIISYQESYRCLIMNSPILPQPNPPPYNHTKKETGCAINDLTGEFHPCDGAVISLRLLFSQ